MREPIRELTNDKVVLRIMETLRVQNKTEKDMLVQLGLSKTTFTRWKYQGGKSYMKYLDAIAEYLNVSKQYLLGEPDDIISAHKLTPSEIHLLQLYRLMDEDAKGTLLKSAELFVAATEDG